MTRHLHISSHRGIPYVESQSAECLIRTTQDMLDILAWGGERDTQLILMEVSNFDRRFFDLSTGLAGDLLQKCSNYHVQLAIAGDYTIVISSRFRELVAELNRGDHVRFTRTREEAAEWLVSSRAGS